MANNPFFRRKQLSAIPRGNQISRQGKTDTTVNASSALLMSPELGSPSGGPAAVPAGGGGSHGVAGGGFQN